MTEDEARRLLARAQRLADSERCDRAPIPDVVRAVGAIQAQEPGAAALGIRARLAGTGASDVDRVLWQERSVVRTWNLRGTLHLIPADDFHWLQSLAGPVGLRRGAKRLAGLGVATPEALEATCAALAGGPLTRHEVADAVRSRGVRLADDPQVPVHLVLVASMHGRVVQSGVRGRDALYALAADWLPAPGPPPPDPLAELARRHVHAHPPAGPEDLAVWSGLTMPEARRGFGAIAAGLREVEVLGRRAWAPRGLTPGPAELRLLPAWDNLLLGHRDRRLTVRPQDDAGVHAGGGVLRPSVTVGGRVEGSWRIVRGRLEVTAVGPVDSGALTAEVDDVVRFRTT